MFDKSFLVAITSNLPILVAPNTTKKARIRSHDAEFHNFSYSTCTLLYTEKNIHGLFNSAAPVSQAIYHICGGERGMVWGVGLCWVVVLGGGCRCSSSKGPRYGQIGNQIYSSHLIKLCQNRAPGQGHTVQIILSS